MNYRVIGRTGMRVSEIALGCEKRCPFGVKVTENMRL